MNLRTGVDMIELARFERALKRHSQKFLNRIFTSVELKDCEGHLGSLAVRFAAKEAVAKALGTGIGDVSWQEIEIQRGDCREPILHLRGNAAALAQKLGLQVWSLSLSHSEDMAVAFVVAIGG